MTLELLAELALLKEQNAQLIKERNAAVDNLRGYVGCKLCKHFKTTVCLKKCRFGTCWEWRGVQE